MAQKELKKKRYYDTDDPNHETETVTDDEARKASAAEFYEDRIRDWVAKLLACRTENDPSIVAAEVVSRATGIEKNIRIARKIFEESGGEY